MSSTARVRLSVFILGVGCLGLLGCSTAPLKRDPRDPLERVNRVTYAVNDALDRAIAKDPAKADNSPGKRQAREALYNEKFDQQSKRYLQDLRRSALIEYK